MAEKILNSRIINKHDTAENWAKATNFVPKQGELIVYDIDLTHTHEQIKIGDGIQNVNDLPFYAGNWEDLTDKPFWSEGPTIVEWDGNTDGLTVSSDGTNYKVSDLKPSSTEIIGGKLTFSNGSVVEITSDMIEGEGYIISIYYGTVYINTTNGSAYDYSLSVTLSKPGIYFKKNTYNQLVSFSYGNEIVYTLDEKFIPDTIARTSDVNSLSDLVGDVAVSEQINSAIKNSNIWTQIYDSGEITTAVNAISGINVSGYKSLKVAIKCVNTTVNSSTTGGAVVFTCENSKDYVFANILGNLIRNTASTSGGAADFKILGNYISCENSYRALNAENMLSDEEGAGADNLTALGGGCFIKCTSPISTMMITNAAQSDTHFYGVGSRVIVWGCKA